MFETMFLAADVEIDENSFGPGLLGFLVTFFLAIALIVLISSMARRIRKVRYKEENLSMENKKQVTQKVDKTD